MKNDIQSLLNIVKDLGLGNVLGHLSAHYNEMALNIDDKERGESLETLANKLSRLASEVDTNFGYAIEE